MSIGGPGGEAPGDVGLPLWAGLTCCCGARGQGCVSRQSIRRVDEEKEHWLSMELLVYGTRTAKDKSGAYLFLPDGEAQVGTASDQQDWGVQGTLGQWKDVGWGVQ